MLYKASAPGSLMLMGEYAVLHGKLALVCAVDKRMTVILTPRSDTQVILSSALGEYQSDLSALNIVRPFQFVLTAIQKFSKKMQSGCDIKIISEFSDKIGFASSAAVTVATISVLAQWLNLPFSKLELIHQAREIVRKVQGLGSGADVAACVLGGIVAYRAQPFAVDKLLHHYPLTVIYSGSKTPTVEAVTRVNNKFRDNPKLFKQICQAIDYCSSQGRQAICDQNWYEFGNIMNVHQGLLDALGVNTRNLNDIILNLREESEILGAKISGSGFGDCVIGLGKFNSNTCAPNELISVSITEEGVS